MFNLYLGAVSIGLISGAVVVIIIITVIIVAIRCSIMKRKARKLIKSIFLICFNVKFITEFEHNELIHVHVHADSSHAE